MPRAPATKPTWRDQAGVFLSRTVFPWPWKRCMFPHEFGLEFADFLVEISEENCCHPLSFHHRVFMWNCETMAEKTVLAGKTTGVSDSYRHPPENVQHGTPKISPSITPFFQIEISIGWFTRLSKSTFHLSHKIFLTPWPFSPVVSPPLSSPQNTPHQQAHHRIQWWSARNGTTSIRRDEGDGLAWQSPRMAWLTPKTAGWTFGDFLVFQKRPFSGNDGGEKTGGVHWIWAYL